MLLQYIYIYIGSGVERRARKLGGEKRIGERKARKFGGEERYQFLGRKKRSGLTNMMSRGWWIQVISEGQSNPPKILKKNNILG
jgi:hypothetical protein